MASACKKLDLAPTDRFTDANYWTTAEKAGSVLNSAYSQISNSGYFFSMEAMSDNAYNGRGDNNGVASLAAGTYDASLGRLKTEWGDHYTGIKTCNIFLEKSAFSSVLREFPSTRIKLSAIPNFCNCCFAHGASRYAPRTNSPFPPVINMRLALSVVKSKVAVINLSEERLNCPPPLKPAPENPPKTITQEYLVLSLCVESALTSHKRVNPLKKKGAVKTYNKVNPAIK